MEELALVISQPDEGKFLQKIGWNKEQIKAEVARITEQYNGLTYTEAQIQDAKKDRATLNAIRKDISDRRIQVKKALMAPYDVFEAEVKEVVALIDKPIAMIDEQLSAYEERVKEEKRHTLEDYFGENVGTLADDLKFGMIFDARWLNKSASLKSCKEEILEKIAKANTDLKAIETLVEEKYRWYAKDFYLRNGMDMTAVLGEVGRMRSVDRKAEEAKAEEERRKVQEALEVQNPSPIPNDDYMKAKPEIVEPPKPEPIPEKPQVTIPAEAEDTKIYKSSFTVRGTKAQLLALKAFMISNNIEFGKVEK